MKRGIALIAILLVAGCLRLPGIRWGIPDSTHPNFSYHPDETLTIVWAGWLRDGRLMPKQFQFGGTLNSTLLNADRRFGSALAPVLHGENWLANTILAGRYFVVALSLLTIILVYEIGRLLFDAQTGVLAALILAITPVHVFLAQNVRPDEAATFIAALIVYLAARILEADPQRDRRFFVGAGVALGAGIALRFPIALFGLAPVVAWLLRQPPRDLRSTAAALLDHRIFVFSGMTVVGYCIASPQTLLHPGYLYQGLMTTWSYESTQFPDAVGGGPGLIQYGWTQLRQALGIPIHLLAWAAIGLALLQRSREQLLLLASFAPYFVLTTFATWVVVRYTLPLTPVTALLVASTAVLAMRGSARWRMPVAAALVAAIGWTVLSDVAFARVESERNVRDEVSDGLVANFPAGARVATIWLYEDDVYFNPPIPGQFRSETWKLGGGAETALESGGADFMILNETFYKNADRLGDRHPYGRVRDFEHALAAAPYHLVAEYQKPVRFAGLDFSDSFTSQDYAIINPGIRIYQRD